MKNIVYKYYQKTACLLRRGQQISKTINSITKNDNRFDIFDRKTSIKAFLSDHNPFKLLIKNNIIKFFDRDFSSNRFF
jgi:hypothetical protein